MLRDCRTVTPGSSAQTQSTWTIREVHQAGGGPGQQAGLAGIPPGASVAKHSQNHRLPIWINNRLKMQIATRFVTECMLFFTGAGVNQPQQGAVLALNAPTSTNGGPSKRQSREHSKQTSERQHHAVQGI